MNKSSVPGIIWGILLVLAGGVWLLSNLFDINIDFSVLWPLFLMVPGLALWAKYVFGRKQDVEVLIPANILLFLSITFLFNTFTTSVLGYERAWLLTVSMYTTGPIAIAFWITWVASGRRTGYIVPAVILTIVSACIASFTVPLALFDSQLFVEISNYGFPLMLILIGLLIVFGPLWSRLLEPQEHQEKKDVMEGVEEAQIVEEMVSEDAESMNKAEQL